MNVSHEFQTERAYIKWRYAFQREYSFFIRFIFWHNLAQTIEKYKKLATLKALKEWEWHEKNYRKYFNLFLSFCIRFQFRLD